MANLLTVEEGGRPRANSDPTVGSWGKGSSVTLPEILVEDCTDSELFDLTDGKDEGGLFGMDASPRPRANTCPEDLFRKRNGRPPTPPPGTFRRGSKFKSGFAKPALRQSVSFVHHRLGKLAEDAGEAHTAAASSQAATERLESGHQHIPDVSAGSPPAPGQQEATSSRSNAASGRRHDLSLASTSRSDGSGQTSKGAASGDQRSDDDLSEAGKAPSASKDDAEGSTGAETHFRSKSSVDCRFARITTSCGLDGTQLQAC